MTKRGQFEAASPLSSDTPPHCSSSWVYPSSFHQWNLDAEHALVLLNGGNIFIRFVVHARWNLLSCSRCNVEAIAMFRKQQTEQIPLLIASFLAITFAVIGISLSQFGWKYPMYVCWK